MVVSKYEATTDHDLFDYIIIYLAPPTQIVLQLDLGLDCCQATHKKSNHKTKTEIPINRIM